MPAASTITVRDLTPADVPDAVGVLARGMRDNPLHVVAYGDDPDRRERVHARVCTFVLEKMTAQEPIVALDGDRIVGVAGATPPGRCQPNAGEKLQMLPALAGLGPRTGLKVMSWTGTWAKHDPDETHVHLGPVGVDRDLQGQGIGTVLMTEHCRRLDAAGRVGYLETDKEINVSFYERFGYVTVGEADVIGVPNWFMRRPAA